MESDRSVEAVVSCLEQTVAELAQSLLSVQADLEILKQELFRLALPRLSQAREGSADE